MMLSIIWRFYLLSIYIVRQNDLKIAFKGALLWNTVGQ